MGLYSDRMIRNRPGHLLSIFTVKFNLYVLKSHETYIPSIKKYTFVS